MEENIQQQLEEFQVLQSIYGDDIQELVPKSIDDGQSSSSFRLRIPSLIERQIINHQSTDHLYHLFQTGLIMDVECSSGYPTYDVPKLQIRSATDNVFIYCPPEMYEEHEEFKEMREIAREIQEMEISELLKILNNKAKESIGQVVMFILIQDIEDYLMEKFSKIKDFNEEIRNHKKGITGKKVVLKSNDKSVLSNIEHTILFYKKETKEGYYAFIDGFYSALSFTKEFVEKKKGMERMFITTACVKPKIYTWGGIYNGALSNDMFEVVEEGKNIKKVKQASTCTPRLFHTFNTLSDGFIIIGGMTDPKTLSGEVCTGRMTPNGIDWQTAYKLANPVCGHAACVKGRYLYTFGGYGKSGFTNDFNCYEWYGGWSSFEKVKSHAVSISPRAGVAMVELDGIIYIFGGHNEGQIFNTFYEFNTENEFLTDRTQQTNFIPMLTMATLLVRDSNTIVLYGGFDGTSWNTNMFEYNVGLKKWLIVPLVPDKNFDNATKACSIQFLGNSYILLGGSALSSLTFGGYEAFLNRALFQKKSNVSEYSVRCLKSEKTLKSEKSMVVSQSEKYFKWFEITQEDNADLIFVFTPEEEESESLTEREKLSCCAHKLVLQRFPEFKKLIMIAEQRKAGLDINTSFIDTYELNHGDPIHLRINYVPEVKNLKKAFIRVLQYIYSGMFDAKDLKNEHFLDIYHLAVYYKLNLLVQSLLRENSLSVFLSQNFKTLERELPSFLKISPDGDVEDIEDFKLAMSENPDMIPDVKQGLVRILAPDHNHNPPLYRSIYAHKLLLCITSKYFAATFNSKFFEAEKRILIMDTISVQSLLLLMSFIYCPSYPLDLNSGNSVEIYVISHLLELPQLQDKARTTIKQFEFDEYTALHILEISNEFGDAVLQDYCLYLLAKDYDGILQRDPQIFNELTPEQRVNIYKKHLTIKK